MADLLTSTDHQRRPSRRTLWAAAALTAGYLAAYALRREGAVGPEGWVPSVAWFGCAAGVLALAVLVRDRLAAATLGAAVVLLGAGWFTARVLERPRTSLSWVVDPEVIRSGEPVVLEFEGVVRGDVRPGPAGEGSLAWAMPRPPGVAFDLAVAAFVGGAGGRWACSGVVRVWVEVDDEEDVPLWRAGDRVRVKGLYRSIEGPRNPGERDSRLWEAQRGGVGRLSVSGPDLVRLVPFESPLERAESRIVRIGSLARARVQSVLEASGHEGVGERETAERAQARALLRALLLGERSAELAPVSRAFSNLGLVHVVSISGFHLVMLTWVALLGLRLVRDIGWLEPALVALLVVAYLLVLPAEAPILRSGAMVLILLATEAAGRRYDRVSALGWIGCAVLLWRPMELWSAGFQLSFALTGVLLGATGACERRLFGDEIRGVLHRRGLRHRAGRWAWRHARTALTVNLLCWSVATPIVAFHTGVLSPLGVLTSLLVMPLVMLVLAIGYAVLLAGVLVPAAGPLDGLLIEATLPMLRLVLALDQLPGMSVRLPALSVWWTCAAAGLILWWFTAAPFSPRRDRRAWLSAASVAAMLAWTGLELSRPARLVPRGTVRIDTLAVGDGTCHLVRTRRHALLWDGGSLDPEVGVRLIPRAVRALGAWNVPTAIVTHANIDHYSGLLDAAGPLGVRRVLVSPALLEESERAPSAPVGVLVAGLRAGGVSVDAAAEGDRLDLGDGTVLEILWPEKGRGFLRVNDTSLVGAVHRPDEHGRASALFTGDIGAEAIRELLSRGEAGGLRAGVLEAPHHGSFTPLAERFIEAVSPEVVLQSTGGRGGRADDPRWVDQRSARRWWVTHRDGAISTTITRDQVRSERAVIGRPTSGARSADHR